MTKLTFNGTVGEWYDFNANAVEDALNKAEGDIEIHAHSYGGSVFEGILIHNLIKAYDKGSVTIVNTSVNASIMSLIARAADKVVAYRTSSLMIHKASNLAWGNAEEMERNAKFLNAIDNVLAKENSLKNGKSIEENMQLLSDETWYIGEDELLASGLVDEIIDPPEKEIQVTKSKDNLINKYRKEINEYAAAYAEHNPKINYKEVEQALKKCDGACSLAAMPSNEKLANSNKGDAMEKELQAKADELAKAKATIEELQNSAKEGEKVLAENIEKAKNEEVARIKDIMAIAGITAYLDNETISAKIYDGKSTANDIKALLYDMEQVKAEKRKEAIEAESASSTEDMLDIDGSVDNKDQNNIEAEALAKSIEAFAKSNKIKG